MCVQSVQISFISFLSLQLSIVLIAVVTNVVTARDNSLMGYSLQLYNSINSYRSKHTVPALRLNQTLTDSAEYVAERILISPNTFDIEESDGLNLFVTPGRLRPSASFVTGNWYNESVYYNYNHPGYNQLYLNFTQLVWKSSNCVGIGVVTYQNNTAVVAKFYPAGNIKGKFRHNVIPKYKKL